MQESKKVNQLELQKRKEEKTLRPEETAQLGTSIDANETTGCAVS